MRVFLDPRDPAVIRQAEKDGIPHQFLTAARNSPVYTLISDWKLALPLHPEFRTMPMVWYIPPASPLTNETDIDIDTQLDAMRIPVRYLANLFTVGREEPVRDALRKILALRRFMREKTSAARTRPRL